jgi:hypothetical protein
MNPFYRGWLIDGVFPVARVVAGWQPTAWSA